MVVQGNEVSIADLDDVIRSKETAGRPKNLRCSRLFTDIHLLDSANRQYDEALVGGLPLWPLEGRSRPAKADEGSSHFKVPDGATGLRFRAQGDFTAAGAVFALL